MGRKHIGSDLDEFMQDEGFREDATAQAIKRVVAWQIQQAMKAGKLTKSALAARMGTSRAALDRLLDEKDTGLTLTTLDRVARALGKRVKIELAA
jgi:DNA-binding Xre family transcriptional regulator